MNRRCTGHRKNGTPCRAPAIQGGHTCWRHTPNPKARANAAVRAEVERWGLGDTSADPGETLLRLLTQSAHRAERYAAELARLVDEHGLHDAMVGDNLILNPNSGRLTKVGEYVRGLAQLEADERDRCAKFSALAIQAGLAERTVRLAERQAVIAERALLAALQDLGLPRDQQDRAVGRLAHHLRIAG